VPDGFGLSYNILPNKISWTITNMRVDNNHFAGLLSKAAVEVGEFMRRCKAAGLEEGIAAASAKL
jgi:hypothetical protein